MDSTPRWLTMAFVLTMLLFFTGGALFFRSQEQRLRREAEGNLTSIVQLKAKQVGE